MKELVKNFVQIKSLVKYSIFTLVLVLSFSNIFSQPQESFDTKGTDFWMNFMPNFHMKNVLINDSLYIFFSSSEETNVNIDYVDWNGISHNKNFVLNASNSYYHKLPLFYELLELRGDYEDNSYGQHGRYSETVRKTAFHITSDKEINVYGLNAAEKSSEAFMVFPTDVLNNHYLVLTYNSNNKSINNAFTPSQMSVIATENDTKVYIIPSCLTSRGNIDTIFVQLNKGETFLVQASDQESSLDLSGSEILSDKPIAVFAGQVRSTIPYNEPGDNPSRDCLIEQMPPMSTWGKNAFVIPFPQPDGVTSNGSDKFRIISSVDDNLISVNGFDFILDKGKIYESNLGSSPIEITAKSPIMVNQYKKSAKFQTESGVPSSDPLMMTIPPKEQFLKECMLTTINKRYYDENDHLTDAFTEQYIFIVAPNNALNDCYLNNIKVPRAIFNDIRNSGYSYAIYQANLAFNQTDGNFLFKSTEKCGLYVVGYGKANSYGYVGGMEMNVIADNSNPQISMNIECFKAIGRITDSLTADSGIEKIEINDANTSNVTIRLDNYFKSSPSVTFVASLIDPSIDGYFEFTVTDLWGNTSSYIGEVPGSTLMFVGSEQEMRFDFDTTQIGLMNCDYILINNYGTHPITLSEYDLVNWGTYTVPPSNLPLEILPGETKKLELCLHPTIVYDSLPDTLRIHSDCIGLDIPISSVSSAIENDINTRCDVIVHLRQTKLPSDYIFEDVFNDDLTSSGKIIFGLPQQNNTKFVIYNAMGKAIKILTNSQYSPGFYELWFGYEDIPSGLYLIAMQTENSILTRKFYISK